MQSYHDVDPLPLAGGAELNPAQSCKLCRLVNAQLRRYDAANGTCTALPNEEAVCSGLGADAEAARLQFLKAACISGGAGERRNTADLIGGFRHEARYPPFLAGGEKKKMKGKKEKKHHRHRGKEGEEETDDLVSDLADEVDRILEGQRDRQDIALRDEGWNLGHGGASNCYRDPDL